MISYLNTKYIKRSGVLVPQTASAQRQQEMFVAHIPEGTIVDCFYETLHDDGTLPQLAKLHAMIRQLAGHIGETFENMKLLVKDRAGLTVRRELAGKEYFLAKSFGECSRDELSLAIQAAIELGEEVNFLVG